jgi:hypothetical protein
MTVVANVGAMPALGVQLGAWTNVVNAYADTEHSAADASSAWESAYEKVIVPFAFQSRVARAGDDMGDRVQDLIPPVRNHLDFRVNALLSKGVTERVVSEEEIELDVLVQARLLGLISKESANALVHSAFLVNHTDKSRNTKFKCLLGGLLFYNGLIFTTTAFVLGTVCFGGTILDLSALEAGMVSAIFTKFALANMGTIAYLLFRSKDAANSANEEIYQRLDSLLSSNKE